MNLFPTKGLLTVALGGLFIIACASTPKYDSPFANQAMYDDLDKNKDGKLNLDEYSPLWEDKAQVENSFKSLDRNNDGFLTRDEFRNKAMFETLDKNKDGRLSLDEYSSLWKDKAQVENSFRSLDRNSDGFLTRDEFRMPLITIFRW